MAEQLKYTPAEKAYILQVVESQKTLYRRQENIFKHIRKMRTLQIDTRTPRSFQRLIGQGVRAPISYSLVQTINGMMAKGTPHFHRKPINPRQQDAAEKLAATCWPLLQTYSKMMRKDYVYAVTDQLVGDGRSVIKIRRQMDKTYPDQIQGEPDRDYMARVKIYMDTPGKSLFRMSLIDPAVFKPDLSEEPSYVVETGKRSLQPFLFALGLELGVNNALLPAGPTFSIQMQPQGSNITAQIDEIWTDEFVYFDIDGNFIKYENEFGFIPYAWHDGMTSSIPDPSYQAQSVAFPYFAMEPYLNTLLTAGLSWTLMAGMPTAVVETAPGPGVRDEEAKSTDLPLGQMVSLKPGQKFSYAVPPPLGPAWSEMIKTFMGLFDRSGVTQLARGEIGTRMPGLTFTNALDTASDLFTPVKTGLASMLEETCILTWKAIEKFNMPMWVTGQELIQGTGRKVYSRYQITPAMIRGNYDLHCQVEPQSDAQLMTRGQHSAFMQEHQLWSTERAMLYAGVDNPIEERLELLKDFVRSTPLYKRQALEAALADDPELQAVVQQSEQQGIDIFGLGDVPENPGVMGGEQLNISGNSGVTSSNMTRSAPPSGGQIRGLPAPTAGGRASGMPQSTPTGPNQVTAGQSR